MAGCYICSVDDAVQTEIGTVKPTVPTQFLVNEYNNRGLLPSSGEAVLPLPDPVATLRDLAARLQPSGRLFVTAPFRPVGWRQGAGVKPWLDYYLLHVPAHVSYLSERWFRQRLGLRLVSWEENHENGQAFEAILAPA
jgi:hypothetical protein